MKIGILGTRGIPNQYGGFEQFAEYLSLGLVKKGHEVWVYNSHTHVYQQKTWNGVNIHHAYDPEEKIGTAGQFIYDLNCILDARNRDFDVLLQLGYTSNSIWSFLLPAKSTIITNMDGLEWKRSKYSQKVQRFLRWAEKKAVKSSPVLVADSIGIQKYLKETYNRESTYIPYGAHQFVNPRMGVLAEYNLQPFQYNMLIARMEPENNIEVILDGVVSSEANIPTLVVGGTRNAFGNYLVNKYKGDSKIIFQGGIYDLDVLNNLRYYSKFYFHGHSVGGTNPSLLEAMASNTVIIAHKNAFNQAILKDNAHYFTNKEEIASILNTEIASTANHPFRKVNFDQILETYTWESIINQYEQLFKSSQ